MSTYQVFFTPTAREMLNEIEIDIRRSILKRIKGLAENPEHQGKALARQLKGYRSIHAAGRYRVVYKVNQRQVHVVVLAAGVRKEGDRQDIYQLAARLMRVGLLDPPTHPPGDE